MKTDHHYTPAGILPAGNEEDWSRLLSYASWVRDLHIPAYGMSKECARFLLQQISRRSSSTTSESGPIFRKLERFSTSLNYFQRELHDIGFPQELTKYAPFLKTLDVEISPSGDASFQQDAMDIVSRMMVQGGAVLQKVVLVTEFISLNGMYHMAAKLLCTSRNCRDLREVHLPRHMCVPAVIVELYRFPLLERIAYSEEKLFAAAPDCADVSQHLLEDGAFPVLRSLDIVTTLDDFLTITSKSPLRILSRIRIAPSPVIPLSTTSIVSFMTAISQSCRGLEHIHIDMMRLHSDINTTRAALRARQRELDPIPLQALSPITTLPFLHYFWLSYTQPLEANDADLAALLSKCQRLEVFKIDLRHFYRECDHTLTLGVLPLLARVCPRLKELALPVNCLDAMISKASELESHTRFENLVHLDLCHSPISSDLDKDVGLIAQFLNGILPRHCSLCTTCRGPEHHLGAYNAISNEIWERYNTWKNVQDILRDIRVGQKYPVRESMFSLAVLERVSMINMLSS